MFNDLNHPATAVGLDAPYFSANQNGKSPEESVADRYMRFIAFFPADAKK
jgi:predicted RNase H-like nuclease